MKSRLWISVFIVALSPSLEVGVAEAAEPSKPRIVDASQCWKQTLTDNEAKVLHTSDGGNHWMDVSPPALSSVAKQIRAAHGEISQIATLNALDARRAWLSIPSPARNIVYLEFTGDAGRHWREKVAPIAADAAYISFLNERRGFLLVTSDPAAGLMKKKLYGTNDGGNRWHVFSLPSARSYYPTGISFRSPSDGWITGTYHGGDESPLYRTQDGSKSWQSQQLPIPADYRGGYADSYRPVFIGADGKKGYLPVKLVRHDPKPGHIAWVNYESDDGGDSWHLPASGIPSVSEE